MSKNLCGREDERPTKANTSSLRGRPRSGPLISLSDLRLRETQRMSQQDGLLCMLFMQIIMLNTACENPSTLFKFLSYQLPPYAKLSSAQSKYFNEAKGFIQRQMEEEAANIIPKADLPTPVTCKSGGFENKSRKTWRLGPQTWRFSKYVSNHKKSTLEFWTTSSHLDLCSRLSFPRNPCAPMFHWNEADIYIVPSFISQIG